MVCSSSAARYWASLAFASASSSFVTRHLGAIPESDAQLPNRIVQHRFGDCHRPPDGLQQLSFGDELACALNEVNTAQTRFSAAARWARGHAEGARHADPGETA